MKHYPFLLAFAAIFLSSGVRAQVPKLVNYQGRVAVDAANFEGTGQFKFALVSSNGTTTFWSNDGSSAGGSEPAAAVPLVVAKGLYSVLLGDTALGNMTAIPASAFANPDVRLRVWFNDGAHGSQLLTPDQRLAPAAYLADGTVTSASIGPAAVTSGKIAPGAVSGTNIAPASLTSGNFAVPGAPVNGQVLGYNNGGLTWTAPGGGVFALNGTSAYYSGGNVGIGTSSPTSTLDVRGGLTLEVGGSPVLFTGTGNAELDRYLLLGNSPTAPSASGLKSGGVLVSNDYSYANPGKNDLIVKGKVGIGSTAPVGKLEIVAEDALRLVGFQPYLTLLDSNTGYARSRIQGFGGGMNLETESFINGSNPSALLTLAPSGNVGIGGSPNPVAKLEVVGQDAVRLIGFQPFLTLLDSNAGYARSRIQGVNGGFVFEPEGFLNGTYPGAAMAITATGLVGVGTTTPSAKFHSEINEANAVAVYGKSTGAGGVGVYAQGITGPAIHAEGNAGQARDKGGFVKAMAFVNPLLPAGQYVVRCYNSQQGPNAVSTPPCGITVTRLFPGYYRINFGFRVDDRFFSVTPKFGDGRSRTFAAVKEDGEISILVDISKYDYDDPGLTGIDAPFTVFVY